MGTKKKTGLIATGIILATATVVFAAFFQSFEFDTSGWMSATRVATLTRGVPSESGSFHAEDNGGAFTRWGGYGKTFLGGYITTVDIYLDISPPYMTGSVAPYPNDTRFDWTSAINNPQCFHRRDFAFNAGFYTDGIGAIPRFVISASNNTGRPNSFPKNPQRDPFTIYVEGWYTFEHRFYAVPPAPGGQLFVDLTIKDATTGLPLHMWTLTTATDIIGTTVGGNRYGLFATDEFPGGLAFDTSALFGAQDYCMVPPSTAGAKVTAGGWVEVLGDKGTFGVTARANASGAPSGNVTYQDHGTLERTVKSTAVTSVTLYNDDKCAKILGMAKVNGTSGVGFQVDVCDYNEPGKDADTFDIVTFDGYTAGGTLGGGNVQIHK